MDEHDGLAAIELVEDRSKRGIARPPAAIAGGETDPVRLEHIEAVGDLAEAALHVEQRQRREEAKPVWMIADHLRREPLASRATFRACSGSPTGMAGRDRIAAAIPL